jgi:hypothetical protein
VTSHDNVPAKARHDGPAKAGHDGSITDALALPVIAFRGLWDKFAAPLTPQAICRAYLRGVPSLVRCADQREVESALEFVTSREFNRARQPILLVSDGSPSIVVPDIPSDLSLEFYAIDGSALFDRTYPIYRWIDAAWCPVGTYIPISAYLRGLTAEDLAVAADESLLVMFESVNVIDDVRLSPPPEGLNDDAIYASVRSLAGATAEVFRVSDLVELDWLHQRIREAA